MLFLILLINIIFFRVFMIDKIIDNNFFIFFFINIIGIKLFFLIFL